MTRVVSICKKINNYNTNIIIDGDKSISIRTLMLASWGIGKSKIRTIDKSENRKTEKSKSRTSGNRTSTNRKIENRK